MPHPTPDDHTLAARLATQAGELLVGLRDRAARDGGPTGRALGREGDRLAHELLVTALSEARPDDAVLSEEGAADPHRLEARRVWIVDPLDGTREYGEPPRTDWAVHVALVVDGEPVAGAVALPGRGLTLATDPPPGPPPPAPARPRVVVSRSRPPAEAARVAAALGGELVPLGSAGAKAMAVVLGEADVYVHSGGQYEWDSAAPVAVARAAGLHASRLDGSPLVYNRPDPWLPDLLVCRPELAEAVVTAARG
ncbi:MAG TPA: 3'(2'),5'-bisphosphate nucleotidase CysQ [Acidimicrobiales bacterium]|jgi:3'(2'), 5'-bisphosphate nucleotidase|nr:3'(2'),5'-bisphosphate nucleotidase CysQ [Acidimicrobiales bacterium]